MERVQTEKPHGKSEQYDYTDQEAQTAQEADHIRYLGRQKRNEEIAEDITELLAEVDEVLDTALAFNNESAQIFVDRYRQKGGQ